MKASLYERAATMAAEHKARLIRDGAPFAHIAGADKVYREVEMALNGIREGVNLIVHGEVTEYTRRKKRLTMTDLRDLPPVA